MIYEPTGARGALAPHPVSRQALPVGAPQLPWHVQSGDLRGGSAARYCRTTVYVRATTLLPASTLPQPPRSNATVMPDTHACGGVPERAQMPWSALAAGRGKKAPPGNRTPNLRIKRPGRTSPKCWSPAPAATWIRSHRAGFGFRASHLAPCSQHRRPTPVGHANI